MAGDPWAAFDDDDGFSGFPDAVDGDTLRMPSGPNVRLWGVDAPELNQQGWGRDFKPVPIGQNAKASLNDIATGGNLSLGELVMKSYGRDVRPATANGQDVGWSLLREGNALAAPNYLGNDPARRASYLEGERLARQNRLGIHNTFAQEPSAHRKNPDYVPDRQTVARFWDTPTPFAGLRKDIEAGYVDLLKSGTADDILAYAKENSFTLDPADVRGYVTDRDAGLSVSTVPTYLDTPAPLTNVGDGRTGATMRGIGDGVLAGGLDEAGAVVDMLGLTPGRENIWNSDRRLADIWANNQQQNSAITGYDDMAHPGWRLGGQIGGGLVVPFGAKAKSVPELFKVGAAYGGLEGFLGTDGDIGERAVGGAIGVPVGGAVGAAGGKALDYVLPRLTARLKGKNKLGEAAEGYADETAQGAAQDQWAQFPDARPRDIIDVRRVDAPMTEAQLRAASDRINPGDVLPIPSNVVADADEAAAINAGRFEQAKPVDERGQLARQTVTNWKGEPVSKVGPVDLVGFLRQRGGLADQGGELSHMGLTNAARRDDFVGQETRFGPLVNEQGMNLDDAARSAWEAGYFPELSERPTVNEFLDGLRDTYEGRNRRFLPDDQAQVANYYAVQSDRFDLEQRIAEDGPIWRDTSVPSDEPQFPPVEAYEDWGPTPPDFAGNINLSKLDSPQDITRALAQTEKRVGFDAATRGRVTHAETERLAAELNMTPEQLLSRRKGEAFSAEQALAARQILAKSSNELVNAAKRVRALENPGDEMLAEFRNKWMRHVAIQEQVAGMTAEAGRALQQFRMTADSRAVRGDVLGALVRAGGGKGGLYDAAGLILDAVEMEPGKFNALVEKAAKPKWKDKLSELYINFLLSNPPTHVVNMVSNTLTAIAQVPEHAAGAAIGGLRRAVSGSEDRILASEVGARAIGLLQGAKEGAAMFAKALRTGEASDFVTKVEGDEYKAISGLKGEIARIPTRLLTAEDELFKGVARRMEMNAQAVRIAHKEGLKGEEAKARIAELVSNPTDDMFARALDYGRYLTFQRKLGEFGQGLSRITSSNLPAKVVIPFVRTPINLMKFATERSPAAPLLQEWRRDFMAGGERRDMAITRVMLGTGLAMTMYEAALEGKITGAVPPDPAKARLMYADGWQPYSVKIGDRYVSYSRLDPLSTTIGVAADMATLPGGLSDKQQEDKAAMLVASIMGNLASKTWLSGVSSFVEGLSDPGRYAGNWLQRTASAMAVPAGVAGVARAIDPVSRKRESIGEAIQARVPGMSQGLLPRRDIFGEPIENDSLGPDLISPFWQSKAKNDPVIAEMLRIGKSVSAPGKQYSDDGERVDYTPEEYDRYHEIAGRLTYNELRSFVKSADYSTMTDAERRKGAKRVISKARKDARAALVDPSFKMPAKGQEPDAWVKPTAAEAFDPWADFEDAE
ncbi:thermonuclease family protein [Croceicoccus bisphenolivorans]|uniref:thermonuclease family protein n=1 Tax=Croceicoccus bisphenolivorans TaxID=1783232 RepID=UPI0008362484|nr:thermonuclease family protein [Croceicoccus bisphenolivorans]